MISLATLSTVFSIQDKYTKPIDNIINATIRAGKKIESTSLITDTFNKKIQDFGKDTKGFDGVIGKTQKLSENIQNMSNNSKPLLNIAQDEKQFERLSQVTNKMTKLNSNNVGKTKKGLSSIIGKFVNMDNAIKIGKKTLDTAISGLTMASEFKKTREIFSGILQDTNKGSALFSHISEQAKESSLTLKDMSVNTQSFLDVTQDIEQLDKLNNMAERLTQLNTNGIDAKSAGLSLTEMMSGNYEPMAEQFNIPTADIEGSGFTQAIETGNMTEALNILDELMNKAGYSQSTLDGVNGNLMTQWGMFTTGISEDFGNAMQGVEETLGSVVMKFNELLQSGKLQPFIDAFAMGFQLIAFVISGIVDGLIWIGEVVSTNWDIIQPILIGIGILLATSFLSQMWQIVSVLDLQKAQWLVTWGPVILVIGIIIYMLIQMGVTVSDVVGFITGVVYAFWAIIQNIGIGFWNFILSIVEKFVNKWNKAVANVKNFFIDLALFVVKKLSSIAKFMDKIFGTDIGEKLDKKAQDLMDSKVEAKEVTYERVEYKSVSEAYEKGFDWGKGKTDNALNNVSDFFDSFSSSSFPDINPDINPETNPETKPDTDIGGTNLEDLMDNGAIPVTNDQGNNFEVDINKEDIKYLKDIADRDYIAQYSTATLAPNVQISFGDVHENADANVVANRVEKILREEIAVVAEGV